MDSHIAKIVSAFSMHPEAMLLQVKAPDLSQSLAPGQFVMVKETGVGWDPFLREPLFVAGHEPETGVISLWVPGGSTTRARLRSLPLHATLDLLGPFGLSMARRREWRQLLLVAEGLAIGALLAILEDALRVDQSVALLSVTPPDQSPYPADALPLSTEYQLAQRGQASATAQEMLRWADGIVAAGSQKFYKDLVAEIREARPGQRGGFAYGLLLEPFGWSSEHMRWGPSRIACANAACRACLVELRREKLLACAQGPVYDLWSL